MADNPDITADYLRSRLNYHPASGVFLWRTHCANGPQWNARYPGTIAGRSKNGGYRIIRIDGREYRAHRLAWLHFYGRWPAQPIDHINRNPDDNSIANLRECTLSENQHNRRRPRNNTSGLTGVSWDKTNRKWIAQICIRGKRKNLGRFDSRKDAHQAYLSAKALLHPTHPTNIPA